MKTLVIDALVGAGFHSVLIAQKCEQVGLARFSNLTNTWSWKREMLEQLELEPLQELYTGMREAREALEAKMPEPVEEPLIVLQ